MNIYKIREVNGKDYTYRGEVNDNGLFHGLGEIHFKNSKYEGEFNNGNMTGQGVYENYLNSIIYDGNFLNGNLHGYCLITFENMSLHAYYDNGKLIKSKSISKDGFLYKEYDDNTKIYSIKFYPVILTATIKPKKHLIGLSVNKSSFFNNSPV